MVLLLFMVLDFIFLLIFFVHRGVLTSQDVMGKNLDHVRKTEPWSTPDIGDIPWTCEQIIDLGL